MNETLHADARKWKKRRWVMDGKWVRMTVNPTTNL